VTETTNAELQQRFRVRLSPAAERHR
jgi:hypothetical protein